MVMTNNFDITFHILISNLSDDACLFAKATIIITIIPYLESVIWPLNIYYEQQHWDLIFSVFQSF